MDTSDRDLVEGAKAGNAEALGRLWHRHEAGVAAVCRSFLQGPPRDPAWDVEDLCTEAFIRIAHGLWRYEDRSASGVPFSAWVQEVAKRVCLRWLADRNRRRQIAEIVPHDSIPEAAAGGEADVLEAVHRRALLRRAAVAVNSLPGRYRDAFRLSLEQMSQAEIARALGIRESAVSKRVQRARALLRVTLSEPEAVGEPHTSKLPTALVSQVEDAVSAAVFEYRVVSLQLAGGAEHQLCVRDERASSRIGADVPNRRRALRRDPRDTDRWRDLAGIYYRSGNWDEARGAYQTLVSLAPHDIEAVLRLGEILMNQDRYAAAARLYEGALVTCPDHTHRLRLQAELNMAQRLYRPAAESYRSCLDASPTDVECYLGLNAALEKLSLYSRQLEVLAKLRRIAPTDVRGFDAVYTPCERLMRLDEALPILERATRLDPNNPSVIKHLFQARVNLGIVNAGTLSLADRLVRLAPDLAASWMEMARAYAELGRRADARAILQRFVDRHPANAEARAGLAWACLYDDDKGLVQNAVEAYRLQPRHWYVAWTMLAACRAATGLIGEGRALTLAGTMRRAWCNDAFILVEVSKLYSALGHTREALATASRAERLAGDAVGIRLDLISVRLAAGQTDRVERAVMAIASGPHHDNPAVLALCAVHLRQVAPQHVGSLLDTAAALVRRPAVAMRVAGAAVTCGRRDLALKLFRRCARIAPHQTFGPRTALEWVRTLEARGAPAADVAEPIRHPETPDSA